MQNFTRDFYVGKKPANPNKIQTKKQDSNFVEAFAWLIIGALLGLIIGFIIARVALDSYEAQLKTFKIIWLATTIAFPAITILKHLIPKSESAKQKEKQQEEDELNRRKEAWAMYQKVINDDDE